MPNNPSLNYNNWPIIRSHDDVYDDPRYDRMFAEWLVIEGVINPDEVEDQVRLTQAKRSARLKAMQDWEAIQAREATKNCDVECSGDHKIHTNGVVSWMKRTVPLKRGRHRRDL